MTPLRKILEYSRNFWSLGAVLIVGLLLILFFWYGVAGAHREFLQKNEELSIIAARRANVLQIKREHEGVNLLKKRLEQSFVTPDTIVSFIEFVESSGRDVGVAVVIGNVAETGDGQVFKITTEGSYSALINFLAHLENSPYLVKVAKVEFNQSFDAVSKTSTVRSTIDLKAANP